jgi:uncharacterized protein
MRSLPDAAVGTLDEIPARTRRVAAIALLLGGALLGVTLSADDGSALFYAAGFALAGIWAAAATLAPRHGRRTPRPADVAIGVAVGAAAFGGFVVAFLLVRRVGFLDDQVGSLLDTADRSGLGPVIALALLNAIAEEAFFRGTLIDAVRARQRWITGIVPYVVATLPSGNVALVLAASAMGAVFTGLRLARHNVTTPLVCHVTWSLLVLTAFPRP